MNRKNYKKQAKSDNNKLKLQKIIRIFLTIIFVTGFIVVVLFISQNAYYLSAISLHSFHSINKIAVHWNKDWSMNMLVGEINPNNNFNNLQLVTVDKTTVRVLTIPNNLFVVENNSHLQLNTIYALNTLQSEKNAYGVFKKYFHDNFGIQLDSYYFAKEKGSQNFINVESYLHQKSENFDDFSLFLNAKIFNVYLNKQVYTDLDKWSLYSVVKHISSQNTISHLTFAPSELKQIQTGEMINTNIFMQGTALQFSDIGLQDEHARIAFYNGTGIPGKAELLGKMIQSRGGNTDFIGSSPKILKKTLIYCQNPTSFPNTLGELKRMFQTNNIKKPFSLSADITVILGQDALLTY